MCVSFVHMCVCVRDYMCVCMCVCVFPQVLSDARGAGLCSSGPLLSGERSSSLVRIVRDSYKDKKPVPSAMAAFAPAIQLDCPQVCPSLSNNVCSTAPTIYTLA